MRYIGSKSSSVQIIYEIISRSVPNGSFCDPFGGTSTVGSFFKSKGYKVSTGDLLIFAHYFQIAKLAFNKYPIFNKLIKYLGINSINELLEYFNSCEVNNGWFIEHYSSQRLFFTFPNACKIQACWASIIDFDHKGLLDYEEKAFLLASLINSMDKVANTAGTYYAYLKSFNSKSNYKFKFSFIEPVEGKFKGESLLTDANLLLEKQYYDIIYLDPPYNDRKYHNYYHLPETIASCSEPRISGKSGVSKNELVIPSNFYNPTSAFDSLIKILENARFGHLLFHYQDNGLLTPDTLDYIFSKFGQVEKYKINSLGYTTKSVNRKSQTQLYILKNA
jgi:adenine-specific DNA-methyltransferase